MSKAPTMGRIAMPARSAATTSGGWACTTAATSGRPQQLGVQRELVGRGVPAVELASRASPPIEVDQPDVGVGGEGQAAFLRAAAAHEQPPLIDAEADVPEDPVGESACGKDTARLSDQGAPRGQLAARRR
jgi:hypothetical protein